jgi:hypothetical protein
LASADVRFVIIGGIAVAVHGYMRATKDLDIAPDPDRANLARLAHVWTCYIGQAAVDHKLILSKQQAYASQPWYVAHCTKRQADQTRAFEKRECTGVGLV